MARFRTRRNKARVGLMDVPLAKPREVRRMRWVIGNAREVSALVVLGSTDLVCRSPRLIVFGSEFNPTKSEKLVQRIAKTRFCETVSPQWFLAGPRCDARISYLGAQRSTKSFVRAEQNVKYIIAGNFRERDGCLKYRHLEFPFLSSSPSLIPQSPPARPHPLTN